MRVLSLLVVCLAACTSDPPRYFSGGVFVSQLDPVMRVRIDSRFEYLGAETFLLGTTHEAQRHHWVNTDNGRVTALIVFQFERILEDTGGQYQFNVPPPEFLAGSNYRFAAEPVPLGEHAYVHNTWAFDTKASAREQPGRESDRTLSILARNGYHIDSDLIMARYVRAVGEDMRKEVILFYMEPLSGHGYSLEDFPDGGPPSEKFDSLSNLIVQRARAAINIL